MKRTILLLIFAAMGLSALAQGPTVTVVNKTGYTFNYLYVSINSSSDWEDDVLGRKTLPDGESFTLTLPANGTYDFKAVDTDDDNYVKWNVVVRGNTTVTLTIDDITTEDEDSRPQSEIPYVTSSTPSSGTWVTVANETGYTIWYLYVSRGDGEYSDSWYKDILDSDQVIRSGESVRVVLPGPGLWDFKVTDSDEDDYFKYDQSMSRGSNRVTFRLADLD